MEDEAEGLRRQSHSHSQGMLVGEGMDPAFRFLGAAMDGGGVSGEGSGTGTGKKKTGGREKEKERGVKFAADVIDSTEEVSMGDTPQMERNKLMRAGLLSRSNSHSHHTNSNPQSDSEDNSTGIGMGRPGEKAGKGKGHTKRKSSARGKRVSSLFEGGFICESPPFFVLFLFCCLLWFLVTFTVSVSFRDAFLVSLIFFIIDARGSISNSSYDTAQPHTSVSDTSFYKHIDCDLPDAARAKQLLIWCSSRALASSAFAPDPVGSGSPARGGRDKQKDKGKDKDNGKEKGKETSPLPPLTEDQKVVLRGVQEGIMRLLVDGKISTSVISHEHSLGRSESGSGGDSSEVMGDVLGGLEGVNGSGVGKAGKAMKANEQNVRNRAREVTFGGFIEK